MLKKLMFIKNAKEIYLKVKICLQTKIVFFKLFFSFIYDDIIFPSKFFSLLY